MLRNNLQRMYNMTLRAIAQNAAKNADSTVKMTATQAKRLDEIDARLPRIQAELDANPSASRAAELRAERTRLTQEKTPY